MSLLQDVQAPRFRKTGKSSEAAAIVESLPQQTKVAHATAQKLLAADKRELAKQLKGQVKDTAAKSKAKPKAKGKAKAKAGAKAKKEKVGPKTNWARRKNSFFAKTKASADKKMQQKELEACWKASQARADVLATLSKKEIKRRRYD
ncbi:hypothetical protein AK812_SmicGene47377 [Symbiodinium microadriaticum]|uniref:Uncharacterized protein n=1 Tax=Symbiodinium microadriaticum TaxID=2951 RepID=A0A1Q9BRW2_SYMMI|nr:hypothetical protein AK812_SmicGene47377 [Symbiodinium microadriaticum]CAE7284927.1 unnamed protein product [Symbiodinium sp. KB8]